MSQTGYPEYLPYNAKVYNFTPVNVYPYNANYDIVWSFEFNLCGSSVNSQGGFTTFLVKAPPFQRILPPYLNKPLLSGGNVGIDLGYSGLSSYSPTQGYTSGGLLSTTVSNGILSAVIGIGFDTTGLFALSASYVNGSTSFVRDGTRIQSIKKESITIRGGYTNNYPLLYNNSLSALNKSLSVLDNTGTVFNKMRFRLGNVGRTLYVDYRSPNSDKYTNLLTLPVSLPIEDTTVYAVGISFASPISTTDPSLITNLRVKNFHIEGRTDPYPIKYNIVNAVQDINYFDLVTEYYTITGTPPLTGYVFNSNISDYGVLDIQGENSHSGDVFLV
ncbi:MAG: hypothetical protein EBU90_24540 [Proteobacteria bacterium]|nr:hypothetical protein [Pseudomonadota bacterium]